MVMCLRKNLKTIHGGRSNEWLLGVGFLWKHSRYVPRRLSPLELICRLNLLRRLLQGYQFTDELFMDARGCKALRTNWQSRIGF